MKSCNWSAVAIMVGVALAGNAVAGNRGNTWEGYMRVTDVQGKTYSSGTGSSAETDDSVGWGFGFGYNVNDFFSLGGSFNWADIDYNVDAPAETIGNPAFRGNGTLETSTLSINGTLNLLPTAFTPFVSGGVGATYIDTNVPNGSPYPVCWYDPWYGYYCGTVVPTKDETDFTYTVGAGLRWDVTDSFFMKAGANKMWVDASGNVAHPTFLSYSLDFGIRFW